MQEQRQSLLTPFLMFIGVILLIIWSVGALNTGNWGWFLPFQPTFEPSRIIVREEGRVSDYLPGDPGFELLSAAFDASFADFTNADLVPLGLSDQTLEEYKESATVVEIFYPRDIRFNSVVRMENINHLLIPIEGRHSGKRYVFLGADNKWLAGAMVMKNDQPIIDALDTLGHIQIGGNEGG